MKIEKRIFYYPVSLYSRLIRVMAERGFTDDFIFWDKFAFKYLYEDPKNDGVRSFT